jgi:hypothetical protein
MSNVGGWSARRIQFGMLFLSGACGLLPDAVLRGDESAGTPRVIRVEEDWTLEVRVPDPDTNAPQVTCVFAPTADVDYAYAEFAVNHHSNPTYIPGGLQLMVWSGGQVIVVNNDPEVDVLSQPNETIAWTQSMSLDDEGVLTFAIKNGSSQTWNAFGNDDRLSIRTVGDISNLNGYDTNVSVKNSGVGFASNRVNVLKITAVRYFTDDGQVFEDSSVHTVFEHE